MHEYIKDKIGKIDILPWSQNFATGIAEVDEQHKRLVMLVNRLANALAYGGEFEDLESVFKELASYAVYHFVSEERVWSSVLADDVCADEHRKTHERFVTEVQDIRRNVAQMPPRQAFQKILTFLTRWLAFHILDDDKKIARVIEEIRSGRSKDEAKRLVRDEMNETTHVLLDTLLAMYDSLAGRTLQLIQEATERAKAEHQAQVLLQRNRLLMQSTPEGIHILDENGRIIEANEGFCRHLGYTPEEVLQLTVFDIESLVPPDEVRANLQRLLGGRHALFEGRHRRKDGTLVDVELIVSGAEIDGKSCFFVLSRDITEKKKSQAIFNDLAFYDALTNLPNRRLLSDRLEQSIAASKRQGRYGALLFLDLDNFKPLNDVHGHAIGDLLLVEVAGRLRGCVRETDTVARFGGDEFIVLLAGLATGFETSAEQARLIAEKIAAAIAEPYRLVPDMPSGRVDQAAIEHRCTVSIGAVLFSNDDHSADDLIREADLAMYGAKKAGRNAIRFHVQERRQAQA